MKSKSLIISVAAGVLALTAFLPGRATDCSSGPFVVFFDEDIAWINPASREILDSATRQVGDCGYQQTLIAGHIDSGEDPEIAQIRIDTVVNYLTAHGIPEDDITAEDFGSSLPRLASDDGAEEPENRRVEVFFAPFEDESVN